VLQAPEDLGMQVRSIWDFGPHSHLLEIRRITAQGQTGKEVIETPSQQVSCMWWWCPPVYYPRYLGSTGRRMAI
jgi:hypothetical protein